MTLTDEHLELCLTARVAANTGGGITITNPSLISSAHDLDKAGWLRHGVSDQGELSWFWTPAGETALTLSGLLHSTEGRMN